MARGVNKVILIGRLGADPEVRYSAAGNAMANISVATSYSRKDQQSGEWVEETEWHRVVLFNRTAEVAGEYLRKGREVYIEGHIRTRKWQDQSGQDRWTTEVVANDMQMLGSRADSEYGGGAMPPSDSQGASSYNRPAPASPAPAPAAAPQQGVNDFDDDIPF